MMDESNIYCIMNVDFVLTNYSTNTNQQFSSVIKLLIDLNNRHGDTSAFFFIIYLSF